MKDLLGEYKKNLIELWDKIYLSEFKAESVVMKMSGKMMHIY